MGYSKNKSLEMKLTKMAKASNKNVTKAVKTFAAKAVGLTPPCPNNPKDACEAITDWMWDMYVWSTVVHYTLWPATGPDGPTPPPKPPFK